MKKKTLQKLMIGAGCLLMAFASPGIEGHAAEPQYRALLVTRGDYKGTTEDLTPGPQNDGVNISRMLRKAYGSGQVAITVKDKDGVTTKEGIRKQIQSAFADAAENDINYFYYSGHGQKDGLSLEIGTSLSARELYDCFEGIKGKNVLILDCCYSGAMTGQTRSIGLRSLEKSASYRDETADFVENFTDAFVQAEKQAAGRQSRTALNNERFRILTAAQSEELSNQVIRNGETGGLASSYGIFTGALVYGSGINAELAETELSAAQASLGVSPADFNGDGAITFNEVKTFVQNHCVANHMKMYPSDSEKIFLPTADQPSDAAFEKAVVQKEADGSRKLEVSYQARNNGNVQIAWYRAEDSWSLQQLLFLVTETDGLIDFSDASGIAMQGHENVSLKKGNGSFKIPLTGKEPETGFYGCIVLADHAKYAYMIPFAASSAKDSLLEVMSLEGNDTYDAASGEEWELTADFGKHNTEVLAAPLVTCEVLDGDGQAVRILLKDEMADLIQISGDAKNVLCRKIVYWDGLDAAGKPVAAGTYTVSVTAQDASGSKKLQKNVRVFWKEEPDTGESESETESESQTETESETESESKSQTETGNGSGNGSQPETGESETQKETQKETQNETQPDKTPTARPDTTQRPTSGSSQGAVKKEVQGITLMVRSGFSGKEKKAAGIVLGKKESILLKTEILPADTSDKSITCTSSNSKAVTVDADGRIKAKKKGSAVITVTAANGVSRSVKVTVKNAPKKVALNAKNRTLKKGKTFQIRAKLPSGSAAFGIRYASSKPKIVSVDAKGKVRALKKGKASVTVKLYNGKKAVLKVNVK